jgi:tetratricopeptide (TPR) repeat protein
LQDNLSSRHPEAAGRLQLLSSGTPAERLFLLIPRAVRCLLTALRVTALSIVLFLLAALWVEAGLRGAALLWKAVFRAGSASDTFTIYAVGESTSFGEPFGPKISFPRIVSRMFDDRLQGRPIKVVNLAQPGCITEDQYWRLYRELFLRPRRDGVVLIYAGINEGWRDHPPSVWRRLAAHSILLSKASWMRACATGQGWPLDYEGRLTRLIALARSYGFPVVVSTLVGNVRDFSPTIGGQEIGAAELSRRLGQARREEAKGGWDAAAGIYAGMLRKSPRDSGLLHRRAYAEFRSGRYADARRHFWEAIDLGETLRPTDDQDQAIRRAAQRTGAILTDSRAAFEAASDHGLPGYDLFMDAHHPNLKGYLLLAEGFAGQISRLYGAPVARRLSESGLSREFGFTREDERDAYATRFMWFCGESSHNADHDEALRRARHYLECAERLYGHPLAAYRLLLALLQHDAASARHWLARKDLLYRDPDILESLGHNPEWAEKVASGFGFKGSDAAKQIIDLAVTLQYRQRAAAEPSPVPGLGKAAASLGPDFHKYAASKARADWGVRLVLSGRSKEGLRELDKALAIYPDNAEAALSLCSLHSSAGRKATALRYCDQAVRGSIRQAWKPGAADFMARCRAARAEVAKSLRRKGSQR